MEKSLTHDNLLQTLINRAIDPFSTCEQKQDIQRILEQSSSFGGLNHLFLVQCYLRNDDNIFSIDKDKAILQAELALNEGNTYSCYFLFQLLKNDKRAMARNYLRLACDYAIPEAYLEMAKCLHKGYLFIQDRQKAYENYKKAARSGLREGFYGMLLITCEDGDIEKQNKIITEAGLAGYDLYGMIK